MRTRFRKNCAYVIVRVIVTRYGGVWPGAIYWFLVLSVEVFDLFTSGLFLIGVVLFMQPAAGSTGEPAQRERRRSAGFSPSASRAGPRAVPPPVGTSRHPAHCTRSGCSWPLYVLFLSIASVLIAEGKNSDSTYTFSRENLNDSGPK